MKVGARAVVAYDFAITRLALLVTAWFSSRFAPSWSYPFPTGVTRGWVRVPWQGLDVWGRYDTFWYLDLAKHGYLPPATDLATTQSNLAFFPLYPYLVRGLHALLPAALQGDGARYVVAVAVANVCALVGLELVYTVVRDAFDDGVARRAVMYLLLFPTSFYLSCAYSESLFLALSAAAILLASRGRWVSTAAVGVLLGLCRPSGILFGLPLAWMAFRAWRGGLRGGRLGLAVLAVVSPGLGFAAHAVNLALLTGIPLAVFKVQSAWGRALTTPWATLLHPAKVNPTMIPFEIVATLLVLALTLWLFVLRKPALALASLACVAPVLLSGTLMSATRLVGVSFPAMAALAVLGARQRVDRPVVIVFAVAQALFFASWCRFYWVA